MRRRFSYWHISTAANFVKRIVMVSLSNHDFIFTRFTVILRQAQDDNLFFITVKLLILFVGVDNFFDDVAQIVGLG